MENNEKLLYVNSNKSGIGEHVFDVILIYTYSQYLNCHEGLYLYWHEIDSKLVGKTQNKK